MSRKVIPISRNEALLRRLVRSIANDYGELSFEKNRWQSQEYIKRCRALLKEIDDE